MTGKIFRAILTVALIVLGTALFVITGYLYSYFSSLQEEQLKEELYFVTQATEDTGIEYLESLDYDNYHITWMDTSGNILFDSHNEINSVEGNLEREEVQKAVENGYGSSVRHSDTFAKKTLYEAVLLPDDTVMIMSFDTDGGVMVMLYILRPIIVIVIVAAIISVIIASKMSRRITKPINSIDLDYPLDNNAYDELSPLLNRISQQNRKINNKVDELRQKTDEFEFITENMNEGLILLDSEKKILSINPAAIKLIGVEHDCIGKLFVKVERKPDINMAIERAFGIGHCEIRTRKNDSEYQFDVSRILGNNGQTAGAVMLVFDVTAKANVERIRREFSANVSHELKTPLQTIMGSAELLENGFVTAEDMPRFVGHIKKEAEKLLSLVQGIIRISQLDEDVEITKENIPLGDVAREVMETLSQAAAAKNITMSLSGENINLYGVRHLIYEVFYNLCDNAIKYNKENGRVLIEISENPNEIVCKITDTGIGIAKEHHERIFERFYRVDKSHSRKSGGTGLGMSIAKHAVIYHNGEISIDSEVDVGTTITMVFKK